MLSLTEQKAVDSVAIKVNGKKTLKDEKGKKLTEPVSRPKNVNTGSFKNKFCYTSKGLSRKRSAEIATSFRCFIVKMEEAITYK